jgi:type II pantothenate kinase
MYSRLQKVQRVFFSGYFIRGHGDTIQCITNAFDYFSKMDGEHRQVVYIHLYTKPYFVKHDGFIGSLGAMAVAYDKYKQKQE